MPVRWEENGSFAIGDTRFRAVDLGLGDFESTVELFILQKPRAMLECYERLVAATAPLNIVELGIWCGGSSVFLQKLSGGKVLAGNTL